MSRLLRFISPRTVLSAALMLMLMVTLTAFVGGIAKANNWTGRATYYGYFKNTFGKSDSPYPDQRGPVVDNNDYASQAIPSNVASNASDSQTTRKQQLFDYLQNKYNNPGTYGHAAWDRTGISFVVNTMLGNDPNASSHNVSGGMWNKLHDQLFASSVKLDTHGVSASAYGSVNTYYQYLNDDVAWYSDPTESGEAIVLSVNGKDVYVLLYKCANPIGNLPGLPIPPKWTITTGTSASKTDSTTNPGLAYDEVIPGDTITWTSTIENQGPDATDTNILWRYNNSGTSPNMTGSGPTQTWTAGKSKGAFSTSDSKYKVQNSDLGKTVCRSTMATPHAWNDPESTESAPVCYNVVWRYDIHPAVTLGNDNVEAGSNSAITVNYTLKNDGPTVTKPTSWQFIECRFNGAAPSIGSEQTSSQPGTAYFNGGGTCKVANSGNAIFPVSKTDLGTITAPTNGLPAGTRLCYGLSATPASAIDDRFRHSSLMCIVLLKAPKIQGLGGDVRADTVKTHTSANIGGKFYGSWAEYGIFGIHGISGMGSASSLANGSNVDSDVAQRALTFANTITPHGYFYSTDPAPDAYYNAYVSRATQTVGPTSVGGLPNPHAIVHVTGNLLINSDISYSGTYANPGDVPRVIYVVDGDITVNKDVQRIDAWLIAKGTLFTCSDFINPGLQRLTTKTCEKPLRFNGPVNVGNTVLGRTYGADVGVGNPGDAAETFNLAPSNFLSTYTASVSQSNIQTVYEKELPPRW